jgi:branched-chain amino acid transport system ATP-binding protein
MSTYYAGLLADIGILTLGALSVYVILATNQLSLGNAGFMAIGSYLSSFLTVELHWPLTGAVVAAALSASVIGIVVGFPALRLKGIYLAIATLGFGEMVRSFFLVFSPMGGSGGYHGMQHVALGYIWIWTAGILLVILLLERSHLWLQMRAVHDDETAAGLVGLNTTLIKVGAFGLGAAIAAVAGALCPSSRLYRTGQFRFRAVDRFRAGRDPGRLHGWGRRLGRRGIAGAAARVAACRRRLAACRLRRAPDHRLAHAAPGHPRSSAARETEFPERRDMSAAGPDALLRLEAVGKRFGGVRALSDISMSVGKNRIIGVIGPNGAGKTTLFNLITGAYRSDTGAIVFDGRQITDWPPHRIIRAGLARTFQNIRLFAGMTVWEHLLVTQHPKGNALRGLLPLRWSNPAVTVRAEQVLKFFGLEKYRDVLARTLPYGIQRKVDMARALASGPRLLLLDEPVAGMNHDEADELRRLLLHLNEEGLTILLIEHDMAFVMNLCHELYVLDFGVRIAAGEPAAIRSDPVVLDAYLGSEAAC